MAHIEVIKICWTPHLVSTQLIFMIIDDHRYTPETPEPAPSLSWHGAQIGGLQVFPAIKITVVYQVLMSPA